MIDTAFLAMPAVPVALYALRDAIRNLVTRKAPATTRPRHLAETVR